MQKQLKEMIQLYKEMESLKKEIIMLKDKRYLIISSLPYIEFNNLKMQKIILDFKIKQYYRIAGEKKDCESKINKITNYFLCSMILLAFVNYPLSIILSVIVVIIGRYISYKKSKDFLPFLKENNITEMENRRKEVELSLSNNKNIYRCLEKRVRKYDKTIEIKQSKVKKEKALIEDKINDLKMEVFRNGFYTVIGEDTIKITNDKTLKLKI